MTKRTVRPIADRFWDKVVKSTDCWIFTGTPSRKYPTLGRGRVGEGMMYAHHLSYEMHHGPIPPGMDVMHSCDTPRCVNPNHLSVGTRTENMDDCRRKGRLNNAAKASPGERNGRARITENDVREIRSTGMTPAEVRDFYGVSDSQARRIVNGTQWKHIH